MDKVAVFHHISNKRKDFHNSIEQILSFDGVLTFDGAYTSVWDYRDDLAQKDAVIFVQGDTVGTHGVMTWEQIEALASYPYNLHLGWHGWTHRRLTDLPDHAVIAELSAPRGGALLYAYPHGDWDERTAKLVKDMGYLRAYSTTQGEEGNDFAIPRIYI